MTRQMWCGFYDNPVNIGVYRIDVRLYSPISTQILEYNSRIILLKPFRKLVTKSKPFNENLRLYNINRNSAALFVETLTQLVVTL